MREYMAAARSPPPSDPTKRKFLAADCHSSQRPFGGTGVDLKQTVLGIARERNANGRVA